VEDIMKKEIIKTKNAPAPTGAYSQAVKAGSFVFTAGMGPIDPKSGDVVAPGDIAIQTKQTLKNLETVLKKAGTSLENIVKITVFIHDIRQWGKFNEAYRLYFKKDPPARTTVEVGHFPQEICVEIDAIAVVM